MSVFFIRLVYLICFIGCGDNVIYEGMTKFMGRKKILHIQTHLGGINLNFPRVIRKFNFLINLCQQNLVSGETD